MVKNYTLSRCRLEIVPNLLQIPGTFKSLPVAIGYTGKMTVTNNTTHAAGGLLVVVSIICGRSRAVLRQP